MDAMQEEFTVYAVEVCRSCGWNHLDASYVLGAEPVPGQAAPQEPAPGGHRVVAAGTAPRRTAMPRAAAAHS